VVVSPECDEGGSETDGCPSGGTDLDGDGDAADRVVRIVDGATGALVPIVDDQAQPVPPQAAEDFVLGDSLVAFRTSESAQGQNLNGPPDADTNDDVLQLYDLTTGELVNTGQAVQPCRLLACDPGRPYRVSQATVRFLTLESDQGEDLNDDGDQGDLLVQVFNAASGEARVVGEVVETGATIEDPAAASDPLDAPVSEAGGEQVFVSSGRCVEDSAETCASSATCEPDELCLDPPGVAPATCVRDTGASCFPDRPPGEQGCPPQAVCASDFTVIAVADADGDEVPDGLDNCPTRGNTSQSDLDGDGAGDTCDDLQPCCDLQTCGNGLIESGPGFAEECDDGDQESGDGCDANCRPTGCGNGILTAGEACEDGNLIPGDGCSPSCQVEVDCDDTIDNDGDGLVDTIDPDPGCSSSADPSERSAVQCDDGQDNDGDGFTDFDPDPGQGDPHCFGPTDDKEKKKKVCGLGFELALGLGLVAAWRRRRGGRGR
jgi:cysteine-rich repeat protein